MPKEKESPKVSVIIPAYNSASSLEYSVKSALVQDYTNIEIIIVNDGSTDETPIIAQGIAHKNKTVKVVNQENRGLGEARNSGTASATGDYIIFLDSDDMLLPWSISEMIDVAEKGKADIIIGKMLETSRPAEEYNRLTGEARVNSAATKLPDGFEDLLYMKVLPSAHAKLYRSALVKNERFSRIRHAEDLEYNLRIFKKTKKIYVLDSPVVEIYALTSGSMMRSAYNDKKHEELQILHDLVKKCDSSKKETLRKAYAASIFFHSIGLIRMLHNDKEATEKYAGDYKQLKRYIKKYSHSVLFDKKALASQRKYALAAAVSVAAMLKMMDAAEKKATTR